MSGFFAIFAKLLFLVLVIFARMSHFLKFLRNYHFYFLRFLPKCPVFCDFYENTIFIFCVLSKNVHPQYSLVTSFILQNKRKYSVLIWQYLLRFISFFFNVTPHFLRYFLSYYFYFLQIWPKSYTFFYFFSATIFIVSDFGQNGELLGIFAQLLFSFFVILVKMENLLVIFAKILFLFFVICWKIPQPHQLLLLFYKIKETTEQKLRRHIEKCIVLKNVFMLAMFSQI